MSGAKTYQFPDGITDVGQIIESEYFKKFVKENTASKAGAEGLSAMYKSATLEGKTNALFEHRAVQTLIIKYLKTLEKNKDRKFKYTFQLAYEGFGEKKNQNQTDNNQ